MAATVTVAAIQLECADGGMDTNLERAAPLVAEAAGRGAQIVLLPELLAAGYRLTAELWRCGEPAGGPTELWLARMAAAHGVWIGATYLQAEGGHFFNTFALAEPAGRIAGRVAKQHAPAVEAYFFRDRPGPHVIDTALGRIGVSICFEAWLAAVVGQLWTGRADLVLMPHSAPLLTPTVGVSAVDATEFAAALDNVAAALAHELGVPTVMANKVGRWRTPEPFPFPTLDSAFPGRSAIVAADGSVVARLDGVEAVAVADVVLDPGARARHRPPTCGPWARPIPRTFRLFAISRTLGRLAYALSRKRRQAACDLSRTSSL
jgi:N-carbamoylputrescine amidase